MAKKIETITVNKKKGLLKKYRIRPAGSGKYKLWEITIPADVIEREARKRDLTVDEFIQGYNAQWLFNDFEGMFLEFIPVEER